MNILIKGIVGSELSEEEMEQLLDALAQVGISEVQIEYR